jgi:putative oxidoreductase
MVGYRRISIYLPHFSMFNCKEKFFGTCTSNYAALVIRVAAGAVMLPHGLQKLGLMGDGMNPAAVVGFFGTMGIPAFIAYLVIVAESVGAVGLILGFLTRFAAASLGVVMLGAIALVHGKNGLSMATNGYEYHVLYIAMMIMLVMRGGGAWSIDGLIAARCKKGS